MSAAERRDFVRLKGLNRLRDALAVGRGVIAFSAHFGNFLILAGRLSTEGIPVNLVVNQMKDPKTERLFNNLRANAGVRTIQLSPTRACAKACMKALKRNEVLVLLIDQNYRPRRGGVAVNFFGRRVFTAPGTASLALACGSPVLPMFMLRDEDGGNTLVIDPPAPVIRTGKKAEDVVANMQGFTKIVEKHVAEKPALWSWMYRRWR
jgi:KDO2-lipid IV(A) lauroyltransferase